MITNKIEIKNPTGLHARPAAALCELAKRYSSKITIICGDRIINPCSVVSILKGQITCGKMVSIIAEGEDEQQANDVVSEFLKNLRE